MRDRRWVLLVAVLALGATISACSNDGGGAQNTIPEVQLTGAPQGEIEAAPSEEPVGMIASGQATLPSSETEPEPVRPTAPQGVQRAVDLSEARDAVAFVLLQPTVLPENTFLQIIQLVEPSEGETATGLPAVRMIYDVEAVGVIVLLQSPATGEEVAGEAVTIGGVPGTLGEIPNGFLLVWESDGVRYELRGSGVSRDALLAAAESMAPVAEDAASAEGAGAPTSEQADTGGPGEGAESGDEDAGSAGATPGTGAGTGSGG